jgi:hypothetical protein
LSRLESSLYQKLTVRGTNTVPYHLVPVRYGIGKKEVGRDGTIRYRDRHRRPFFALPCPVPCYGRALSPSMALPCTVLCYGPALCPAMALPCALLRPCSVPCYGPVLCPPTALPCALLTPCPALMMTHKRKLALLGI